MRCYSFHLVESLNPTGRVYYVATCLVCTWKSDERPSAVTAIEIGLDHANYYTPVDEERYYV